MDAAALEDEEQGSSQRAAEPLVLAGRIGRKRPHFSKRSEMSVEAAAGSEPAPSKRKRGAKMGETPGTYDNEDEEEGQEELLDDAEEEDLDASDLAFDDFLGLCRSYRSIAGRTLERLREHAARWPAALTALLPRDEIQGRCQQLAHAIEANGSFWDEVASGILQASGGEADDMGGAEEDAAKHWGTLQALTYSLVREWSDEGASERDKCFERIVRSLEQHVAKGKDRKRKVLVPGAALMRLPLEIVKRGYAVEAIELCMGMVLLGTFLTQQCPEAGQHTIHPFIEEKGGHFHKADQFRSVSLPDVAPKSFLASGDSAAFQVTMGDFIENTTGRRAEFDAVATAFFLDTASMVPEYVVRIAELLRPGGVWVNVGPLHFHWADVEEGERESDGRFAASMELSWDTLKAVIQRAGFEFVEAEAMVEMGYTSNRRSSVQTVFKCVHFVARRKCARD